MDLLEADSRTRVDLESVIANAELHQRAARPPNHEALSRSLMLLAREMGREPGAILQKLAETALDLCQAHSAGISLLEEEDGREIFRWHALAGQFSPNLWGTMPREQSPCGTVLDQNATLLMRWPDRYYRSLVVRLPLRRDELLTRTGAPGALEDPPGSSRVPLV